MYVRDIYVYKCVYMLMTLVLTFCIKGILRDRQDNNRL
jgi:hypothetical protein